MKITPNSPPRIDVSAACLFCESTRFKNVFHYDAPPAGEVVFSASQSARYQRDILQCQGCAHYTSTHKMDLSKLYSGDYVSSTYKDAAGIARTFQKIISLDPKASDNVGRVQRIVDFMRTQGKSEGKALDVGSGLGVFPYALKKAGWDCTALDPDTRAVEHLKTTVGVQALCGDFLKLENAGSFDLITFNKVLEHVENPIAMLAKAASSLKPDGVVYIELPDGEMAATEGKGREEFFIDHWHVFSPASMDLLARKAGFKTISLERLREPSSKFTLRAFLRR